MRWSSKDMFCLPVRSPWLLQSPIRDSQSTRQRLGAIFSGHPFHMSPHRAEVSESPNKLGELGGVLSLKVLDLSFPVVDFSSKTRPKLIHSSPSSPLPSYATITSHYLSLLLPSCSLPIQERRSSINVKPSEVTPLLKPPMASYCS